MEHGYFQAIQNDLEDLIFELSLQCLTIKRGLGNTQRTGAIFASHPVATDLDSILWLRDYALQHEDPDLRERALRVYFACVSQFIRLDLILRDETFAEFATKAGMMLSGKKVALAETERFLLEEPSFERREAFISGMRPIFAKASMLKQSLLEGATGILREDFGYNHLLDFYETKKGFEIREVRKEIEWFLRATDNVYYDHIPKWVENVLGTSIDRVSHLHMLRVLNWEDREVFGMGRPLTEIISDILRSIGVVDPLEGKIRLDFETRPGKSSVSRCVPLRVPQEVYVILRPTGGLVDVETALHEIGHAMHLANTDPSLPYPYRHLPRSFSLAEMYGFLFESMMMEPSVLCDSMKIQPSMAEQICREKALRRLYVIRRYAGKLLFETEFLARGELGDWSSYPLWMNRATGFLYKEEEALLDMEEELYCADYLRAWAGEIKLRRHIETIFGRRWFKERELSAFLQGLWSKGDSLELERLLSELGCGPLSLEPLAEEIWRLPGLC